MMRPEKSLTRSSRGRIEVRTLVERGSYVIVEYRDPADLNKVVERKFKIYLRSGDRIIGYLMIPLKEKGKYLALEDRDVDRDLYVFNREMNREEPAFTD